MIKVIADITYRTDPKLIRTEGSRVLGYRHRMPILTPTTSTYAIVYGNGTILPVLTGVVVLGVVVLPFVLFGTVLLLELTAQRPLSL